jgi:hypothetical protein
MQRKSYRQIKKTSKSISGPATHRSASALTHIDHNSNSQTSQQSKRSDVPNRWECESHLFDLKPLQGEKTYYKQTSYKMMHEGNYRPYPVVLTEFMSVGLIPLFGLERDAPSHRHSIKRCTEGLQTEVSRITH